MVHRRYKNAFKFHNRSNLRSERCRSDPAHVRPCDELGVLPGLPSSRRWEHSSEDMTIAKAQSTPEPPMSKCKKIACGKPSLISVFLVLGEFFHCRFLRTFDFHHR